MKISWKDLTQRYFKNIYRLIIGTASKGLQGIALSCVLIFFIIACLIAQSYYPGGYSFLNLTISAQGSVVSNPIGQWYFNNAIKVVGILLMAHILYIYRRLAPDSLLFSRLMLGTGLIGSFGFFILGFVPSGGSEYHYFVSAITFNGFGFAAFFSLFAMLGKAIMIKNRRFTIEFLILVFVLVFYLYFIAFLVENNDFITFFHLNPKVSNFPFREWSMMILMIVWLVSIYLILPNMQKTPFKDLIHSKIREIGKIGLIIQIIIHLFVIIVIGYIFIYPGRSIIVSGFTNIIIQLSQNNVLISIHLDGFFNYILKWMNVSVPFLEINAIFATFLFSLVFFVLDLILVRIFSSIAKRNKLDKNLA